MVKLLCMVDNVGIKMHYDNILQYFTRYDDYCIYTISLNLKVTWPILFFSVIFWDSYQNLEDGDTYLMLMIDYVGEYTNI